MCGRFALFAEPDDLLAQFGIEPPEAYAARYNIAPSQPVLAVVEREQQRTVDLLSWGLLPSWSKDPSGSRRPINARAETVAEKPSFRAAFRRRRCLVPASGYYEWQKIAGGKQPVYIDRTDRSCFAIAGIWEYWERDGNVVVSLALLTCAANAALAPVHHRMPVIIEPDNFALWLAADAPAPDLQRLLAPAPAHNFATRNVSRRVNSPANDSPACVLPEAADA